MYDVHKFMALDAYQVQYFIHQVGLSAASFGVADADIEYVGHALQGFFGVKCAPETKIIPDAGKELQSICIAVGVPLQHLSIQANTRHRMTVPSRQTPPARLMGR